MKYTISILAVILSIGIFSSCQQGSANYQQAQISNEVDSASYALGILVGSNVLADPVFKSMNIDPVVYLKGFMHAFEQSEDMDMDPTQANMCLQQIQTKFYQEKDETSKKFFEENKTKEGVVETASGLQYKIIEEGEGESPKATDQVMAHYQGKLLDGTEFDSSYERGEPLKIPVGGVIQGWQEALQLMKPGSKWELYIPSNLGYGQRGSGPKIGPNEPLVFQIELIEVLPAQGATP